MPPLGSGSTSVIPALVRGGLRVSYEINVGLVPAANFRRPYSEATHKLLSVSTVMDFTLLGGVAIPTRTDRQWIPVNVVEPVNARATRPHPCRACAFGDGVVARSIEVRVL